MVRLGDICEKKIDTIKAAYKGDIDYVDISSIDNQRKVITQIQSMSIEDAPSRAKQLVFPGDILVSTVRPNLNAVALITKNTDNVLVASTGYCVLRCLPNADNKYVFYFCQSPTFIEKLVVQATGASYPAVTSAIVRECALPFPPLEEQRKIAAVLDKVSDLIAKRRQQLDKLDELVKSRFIEMFGGIHDSKLYPYAAIGSFTTVLSGGTPDRKVDNYWRNGNVRWVKTAELQNCVITDTEERITQEGMDNSSAKKVPVGSVLIAMYGQGKTRGMTGYLAVECTTNQACACILPTPKINQTFLWQYMILSYDKLRNMAKGGNQPNLNIGIIKSFPVLLPPMALQEQFAVFVTKTDKSKFAIQKSLEKLEILKKALMQKYFG